MGDLIFENPFNDADKIHKLYQKAILDTDFMKWLMSYRNDYHMMFKADVVSHYSAYTQGRLE